MTLPDSAVEGLRNRPGTRYVEADGEMRAIAQTLPWGIDELRSKSNGTGIVVTATDTDGTSGSDARSI